MRKTIILSVLLLALPCAVLSAQDGTDKKVSIAFDARIDGKVTGWPGEDINPQVGFGGKFINIVIDGSITDKLTYAYRQRLFLDHGTVRDFFNATDWLYLKYRFHKNFYVSGGKEVINVGGFEYDANPIDVYFASNFWNNLTGAYQFGATLGYISGNGNHTIKAQVTNSPFAAAAYDGRFAYNLLWTGKMGCFTSLYSVNMIETHRKGHFLNYIALGNRFDVGPVRIDFDYTNRYAAGERQNGFFSDFSVNCNVTWAVAECVNIFVKGGYDQNLGQDASLNHEDKIYDDSVYDIMVRPGVQYAFYGAGAEFFPLKGKRDLRLHAFICSDNTSPAPITFNAGIRWRMTVFSK